MMLLLACADESGGPAAQDYDVDLRLGAGDYDDPGADGMVIVGPDVVVGAGEDKMFCLVGTYAGDDMGVHDLITYQNTFGHHLVLMGMTATELDHPDGEIFECTTNDQYDMTDLEPIVLPTAGFVDGVRNESEIQVPDGTAVKLDAGQRWLLQAHYLNTGVESFRAQDVAVFTFLDPDTEVDTWAAPFVLNKDDFSLPPGEATTASFDCTFDDMDEPWSALYLNAHMHEWGTSFGLTRTRAGATESVIDIPTWDPYFRDAPPTEYYEPGSFTIEPGDTFTTTCNWYNDTDETIEFPHEMCDSVGLVYPQLNTVICDAGEVE